MLVLLFCALLALAVATPEYQSPYYVNTGNNQQYRTQDESGNYRFGYDESHESGGTFRDETGDAYGNKWGSYGLRDADGRYRVVNYIADSQGFRAEIKSNEQGLAPVEPVAVAPISVKTSPASVKTAPSSVKTAQSSIKTPETVEQKPILYASPVSHASPVALHYPYNPEYPLLYHHNPHPYYPPYASYGTYKGTPFRRYSPNYKGTPYRGAPVVTRHGYYIYP